MAHCNWDNDQIVYICESICFSVYESPDAQFMQTDWKHYNFNIFTVYISVSLSLSVSFVLDFRHMCYTAGLPAR